MEEVQELKQIWDLIESLRRHDEILEPKEGSKPEIVEYMDYGLNPTQPHMETSYIPDLVASEF